MRIDVTPAQLAQLVTLHLATLRGGTSVSMQNLRGLESLGSWVVEDDGWCPDGLYRTRQLLSGLSGVFEAEGHASPYGGHSRADMAQAVRILWGIDRYPGSAKSAAEALGIHKDATTLKRWEQAVLHDRSVLDHACRLTSLQLGARGSLSFIDGAAQVRPAWSLPADNWPPPRWFGGRRAIPERTRLCGLVRASLGAEYRGVWDVGLACDEVDVLREASCARLAAFFADSPQSSFYRHLHHRIFREWFEHDALALYGPEAGLLPPTGGGSYPAAVAAAAQMSMYVAAFDRRALLEAVDRRVGLIKLVAALPERPPSGMVAVGEIASRLPGLSAQVHNALVAPLLVRGIQNSTGLEDAASPASALDLAYTIRASSGDAKRILAYEYIRTRPRRVEKPMNEPASIALALADQSVQWDLVTMEDESLVRELGDSMLQHRALAKHAYLTHLWRCQAVIRNKNNDWRGALHLAHTAYQTLAVMYDSKYTVDLVEVAEAAHQIELALSGIYVRLLERSLLVSSGKLYAQSEYYARGALWWSRSAFNRLDFLRREEGGLPLRRHESGRISTVAWQAQTRIIRLRTLLAVRTALDAKICGERGLRMAELGTPRTLLADVSDLDDASLPSILDHYRELVVMNQVTAAHQLPIVHLAAWIAFLNAGNVPVELRLAPGLRDLMFLDCDPLLIETGRHETPIDLASMTMWLCDRGQDAGILNWLPLRGPAAKLLDRTSEGRYSFWRKMLVVPLIPSHD